MIDLLGIGVHAQGVWRLRRLCARVESRAFVGVLSPARDARVGVVDLGRPLASDRTVAGNVLHRDGRAGVGGLFPPSWPPSAHVAARARARVGLAAESRTRTGDLDASARVGVAVARALRGGPAHLVVAEPDARVPAEHLSRLLQLLRTLIGRDGLSVVVSFRDPDLARHTDVTLQVAPRPSALA